LQFASFDSIGGEDRDFFAAQAADGVGESLFGEVCVVR
jgi:hypothetical protein